MIEYIFNSMVTVQDSFVTILVCTVVLQYMLSTRFLEVVEK